MFTCIKCQVAQLPQIRPLVDTAHYKGLIYLLAYTV